MIDLTEEQIKELAAKYPDSLINLPKQINLSEETLNLIAKSVQERIKEPNTLDHVISTVNASKQELGKQLGVSNKAVSNRLNNKYDIGWKDIEILNDENGRPYVNINKLKNIVEFEEIDISLSHCKQYATATVVILG